MAALHQKTAVTVYISADRPTLPPAYVKRSLSMIWLSCPELIKALSLAFVMLVTPGSLSVP